MRMRRSQSIIGVCEMTARKMSARDGFTLVEVLAAFAIGAVIIAACAALIHNVVLNFDRGTKTVDVAERFVLAIDRLSADFASARAVARRTEAGPALAFLGETGSGQTPSKILFVAAAPVTGAPLGDEVVMLTIEQDDKVMRLVRRRASWPGPTSSFTDVTPDNPVVLIEGKWSISFLFGRLTPERGLAWHSSWIGEALLPRFVRLVVRDSSGRDVLGEADFIIRADAPASCGRSDASASCLTAAPPGVVDVGGPAPPSLVNVGRPAR
jgi:prepilin-type N-terminal cleavage/methylation domain-containing protein